MAEAARACSNQRRVLIWSWVMPPTTGVIKIKRESAENITINHGCGGGNCGGASNSSGDDGSDSGDSGNGGIGGGRESKGGIGCGRADNDGDDEDGDGGCGGGKSNNVTTVTGTVAMGLAVAALAKATMMTLFQCMRVKRSTSQVAAAVAAVAAVNGGEDVVQWRRRRGAFNGHECGMMSGQDGGTMRVNAATIRHD